MSPQKVRVVKVGGSLFDYSKLKTELKRWFSAQSQAVNILIAGGGSFVDTVRKSKRIFNLSDEDAHWLSISLMDINAELLAKIMNIPCESNVARPLTQNRITDLKDGFVLRVTRFLRETEPSLDGCPLPHDWSATSDSIAARIAEYFAAGELVLLKSNSFASCDCREAAEKEYVDRHFPIRMSRMSIVRLVNLRTREFPETVWKTDFARNADQ